MHTDGAQLRDAAGHPVRLTGINWFGLETCSFAPHGLWSRNWLGMMVQIKTLGFNTIRLPFSSQLLDPASHPNGIDYGLNPDLRGLSGLQIMDKIVAAARTLGLRVLLDRHRPDCGAQSALWYTDHYSEARWIADWVMLAKRYAGNDAVIGADLHNEPHGPATWGDGNPATDWRLAAERAGNAILRANPNWLIVVEGVEHLGNDWYWWGGNLANAGRYPVRLSVPQRLVYSLHDYGPEVSQQAWFAAPDFPHNLAGLWERHWGYLLQQGIAPVLVGEFGGKAVDSGKEGAWIHTLVSYIRAHALSFTFWCLNPNSGDTGGILKDDWATVNAAKMALLRPALAPLIGTASQSNGRIPDQPAGQIAAPPSRPPGPPATLPAHGPHANHRPQAVARSAGRRFTAAQHMPALSTKIARLQHSHRPLTPRLAVAAGTPHPAWPTESIMVHPSVSNGISTGEDDLSLILAAPLYRLSVTISVHRSAAGTDPGEANPQALLGGALVGHSSTGTAVDSAHLMYMVTSTAAPAGHAVVSARFDFTSGRQNQSGAHRYGQDTFTIRFAATPAGRLTTLEGRF